MIQRSGTDVVLLRIDAASTRNALGVAELEALAAALDDVRRDGTACVVLLCASGSVFSSGADRADLADPAKVERSGELLRRIIETIAELDQPVLCEVNGDAYGGALAIIAAADLTIAADHAHVALPEAKFGLVATVAAGACVRRIGLTAALDIMLTGRRVPAAEAHEIGLFSAVVPAAELHDTTCKRVNDILLGGPRALAVTKRMIRALAGPTVGNDLVLAAALGAAASPDEAAHGVEAMAAKTSPGWVRVWDGAGPPE